MINAYYNDGAIANIGQGHASNFGDVVSGIKIVGEKGNLVITDACYHNGEKVADDADYANSFYHQANHFVGCILENKKPLSGLEDVRDTLKVIYAAYRSAEEDEVVRL
jgi:predicted dehydrogenase